MNVNIKRALYKWICIIALMLVSIILETTIFSSFRVFGASPVCLPFIAVTVALLEGVEDGVVAGFVGGFLCDAIFSGYEGFYTVILPILIFAICLMNTIMYWKNYGMAVLDWGLLIALLHLIRYLLYMLAQGKGSVVSLLYVIPGEFFATLALTPFLYIIVYKIIKRFKNYEED